MTALLKGEQLAPPAPLPPELFTTPEVEQYRPMLQTANRNWQMLNTEFAQRLLLVFEMMREQHSYEMTILEGYRSPGRQDVLSKLGPNVTNAKAWQSYHQYGLAADCGFVLNGKIAISKKDRWAIKGYGAVWRSGGIGGLSLGWPPENDGLWPHRVAQAGRDEVSGCRNEDNYAYRGASMPGNMIVLGDSTSHGGKVVSASPVSTINGKGIARVGDMVSCPRRGHGTCEIVSGDTTCLIDGKPVARAGDKTACGAELIPTQALMVDKC